jgi:hypothetical protein
MPKEIGIILLPDDKESKEVERLHKDIGKKLAEKKLDRECYPSEPHISLFQLVIKHEDEAKLEEAIKALCKGMQSFQLSMHKEITVEKENVFWNTEFPEQLKILQQKIIDVANGFRDKGFIFPQLKDVDRSKLSEQQRTDIDKYGIFWGLPHTADSHCTLYYGFGTDVMKDANNHLKDINPKFTDFKIKAIAVGELGPMGNVLSSKVIQELSSSASLNEQGGQVSSHFFSSTASKVPSPVTDESQLRPNTPSGFKI